MKIMTDCNIHILQKHNMARAEMKEVVLFISESGVPVFCISTKNFVALTFVADINV